MPADFSPKSNEPVWYDIEKDALLIEQSIAKQYGVLPAAQDVLSWEDWNKLVSGLMDDTPLGRVVAVRSEQDADVIKHFSPWQKRIRVEWDAFLANQMLAKQTESELRQTMDGLEAMLARAFGGDN